MTIYTVKDLEERTQYCENALTLEEKGKGEDQETIEPCSSSYDLSQRGVKKTTRHCENTSNREEMENAKLIKDQSGVLQERKKSNATSKSASITYAKPAAVCRMHADVEKEIEDWQYTTRLQRFAKNENDVKSMETKRRPRISTQM